MARRRRGTRTRDNLERLLEAVARDMVTAAIHHKLHADLLNAAREYAAEMNEAPAFWSLSLAAHFTTTLACLIRVYDKAAGSAGLPCILRAIKQNPDFFDPTKHERATVPDVVQLDSDIASVSNMDPLVGRLLRYRNKLFSHREAATVQNEQAWERASALSPDDIVALISRAKEIANRYGMYLKRHSWSTQIVGSDDYRTVLSALREHYRASEDKIKKEIEEAEQNARNWLASETP